MVLLPEEAEMTLAELRQMAARQQHQIEAQQQLLIAKEQRLKFLKQQEARHHHLTELKIDPSSMQNLKEKVDAQGLKLRQLRALHGQVEQQKTNNCNLGAELESVRALFSEKEKELSIAVTKVEELTRQLNDIRKNTSRKSNMVPLAVNELENLRRELMYRTKLTEQQNQHISQQRNVISKRQKDIHQVDDKIAELTQRLRRKRLMNQQLANQIHNAALARHTVNTHTNVHSAINIAAVEPIQRELQDPDQTRDDLSAKLSGIHQSDLYEFSLKKNDPKYQTLPYNTKFHVKGKSNQEDFSPPEDDSSDSLTDFQSGNIVEVKPNPNMGNFVPRPFSSSFVSNNHVSVLKTNLQQSEQKKDPAVVTAKPNVPVHIVSEALNNVGNNNYTKKDEFDSANVSLLVKHNPVQHNPVQQNPVQHNRPVFDKIESAADYKKTKEKFSGAIVKPVVPPKPSFPVKPLPPPRQTPVTPTKERSTEDTSEMVSKALSVLQNKSTEKEKNAFRYNTHNNSSNVENSSASEPKIATYFPKPSSVPGPNKNSNIQDNVKRKQTAGQLPIKPKPLTIRKTPGLEPPKLKQQQNSSTSALRKVQETNILASNFKPAVSPLLVEPTLPQTDSDVAPIQEPVKVTTNNLEESDIAKDLTKQNNIVEDKCPPFITVEEVKSETESLERTESDNKQNDSNFKSPEPDDSDGSSGSPCDSLECVPIHESSEVIKTEPVNGEKETSFNQNTTYHRVKGNLKTETSVRSPRRVSFDPLALLLDAALEGELELVKKTIREVPNPSAANDEGITALHNSICAGHFDVVTFLVEFGCDLNAPDSDGWTPLHCAASCNNLPMVKFLVERGACIFATTLSDHETAAEKCDEEEEGFEGCSEYLYGLQENLGIIYDGIVYAVYGYEGQNADELSFKDSDQIKVLRNGDEQEKEWWWARLNDEEGYIPRNLLGLYPRISIKKDEK